MALPSKALFDMFSGAKFFSSLGDLSSFPGTPDSKLDRMIPSRKEPFDPVPSRSDSAICRALFGKGPTADDGAAAVGVLLVWVLAESS